MPIGQGFVQSDRGIYLGVQSAKGSPVSTLFGGLSFTRFEITPVKEITEGEPMLGGGNVMQESIGRSYIVNWTAEGWITLDKAALFFLVFFATKGSTTGSGPYTHPFTLLTRNVLMKYLTILAVYGESAMGTGIQKVMMRDCRMTAFSMTISTADAVKFTMSGNAISSGPGAATPTLTFDNSYHIPAPVDATNNQYNYPSWFPASNTICTQSLTVAWNAESVVGPACLQSGEHSDIFIPRQSFRLTHAFMHTSDMVQVYNHLVYGTASPANDTSQMNTALKKGPFDFKIASQDIAGGSTPYSFAMSFPDLQWQLTGLSNATPDILTVDSTSFGGNITATIVNATAGASMAL